MIQKTKIQNILGDPYIVSDDGLIVVERDGKIEKMELKDAVKFIKNQRIEEQGEMLFGKNQRRK